MEGVKRKPKKELKIRAGLCYMCARDGHGKYHPECYEDCVEWQKHGVRYCWRPKGTIFVYDEKRVK